MKHLAVLPVLLCLGFGWAAGAQDVADKARLDEFAPPAAEVAGLRIEQLDDAAASIDSSAGQALDRELTVPGPPQVERAPLPQLSQPGQTGPAQQQVSERGESRRLAAGSVSSSDDSRPQASAPLGGRDRCDPQLETQQLERCLRVLERRAAEFSAPEAPTLSAEQVLLAERGDDGERVAARSSDLRLRLAAGDPDAEIASNQELASIYLDRTRTETSPAAAEEPETPDEARLAAILQGLQIELPPSAP